MANRTRAGDRGSSRSGSHASCVTRRTGDQCAATVQATGQGSAGSAVGAIHCVGQQATKEDEIAGRHNDDFEEQMREVGEVLGPGDFVVLYFCPSNAEFFPTVDEIRKFVNLTTVYEQPDGCIYRVT